MVSNGGRSLHVFFFPFFAHGHITPMVETAKLFSSRGVKATIITTPLNAPLNIPNDVVHVQTINFPCLQITGLPQGCENLHSVPSKHMIPTFLRATTKLREPFEQALSQSLPDCVVADMMFPWATASAAKFGIPRIVFHGTGIFCLWAVHCIALYRPYDGVSTDSEEFVIPGLPGEISMTRVQVPDYVMRKEDPEMLNMFEASEDSSAESYGVVVNSFYELEQDYVNYYRYVRKLEHSLLRYD